jgi:ribosomally synthesized peptide (two-chain TOMM family)
MQYKSPAPVYDTFLTCRAMIIRAIALSWKDRTYHDAFREDPKRFLKREFGYTFPYDMTLKIQESTSIWRPELVGSWIVEHQNKLKLVLPPKPAEGEEPIALAAYIAGNLTFLTPIANQEA